VRNTGCRFFNVYGPRQDPGSPYSGVISIFFNRIGRGQGITIFGDGGQTRDFIYVADVVEALLKAMGQETPESSVFPGASVFNVCTGKTTSLLELAAAIGRVFGRAPEIAFAEARAGDIRESLGNPAAARDALGFTANFRIEEGLSLMAEHEGRGG
jgi:UDP-glucose 4-epimerase